MGSRSAHSMHDVIALCGGLRIPLRATLDNFEAVVPIFSNHSCEEYLFEFKEVDNIALVDPVIRPASLCEENLNQNAQTRLSNIIGQRKWVPGNIGHTSSSYARGPRAFSYEKYPQSWLITSLNLKRVFGWPAGTIVWSSAPYGRIRQRRPAGWSVTVRRRLFLDGHA